MGNTAGLAVTAPSVPSEVYPEPIRFQWRLIAEARVANPHVSVSELAQMVGYTYQAVASWLRSPKYIRYENWVISKVLSDVLPAKVDQVHIKETFQQHAADMQQRLLDILDETKDQKLQVGIAQDWLDRAGFSVAKRETKQTVVVLSNEAVQGLVQRAREAGLPNPLEGVVVKDGNTD